MSCLLGAVADDFTGATDLANTLARAGMRTVQLIGVPPPGLAIPQADALVVALKSRSNPPREAVAMSLEALRFLREQGARQILFKYCSTFDSTDQGNIGPVADALLDALGSDFTIACPAFPENKRTIYQGYLFVGDVLLSESSMKDHPLTPMRDPSLVRVLGRQTRGRVGLVAHGVVRRGATAIANEFAALRTKGVRHAIVDALQDQDLKLIGEAAAGLPLITGGSGIGLGLPDNFRRAGLLTGTEAADQLPKVAGLGAVIAGSCSAATLKQIEHMRAYRPVYKVDPRRLAAGDDTVPHALAWAADQLAASPLLFYSSASADDLAETQQALGREQAAQLVEHAFAQIALGLKRLGIRRLVVAGGETAGAVVKALDVRALQIGPQIDPGVPWTLSVDEAPIALALKSGNFGAPDFFLRALAMLDAPTT